MPASKIWTLNIPELLGIPSFALDDADVDKDGNLYVSDSVASCIYKFAPTASLLDTIYVSGPGAQSEYSLNFAVGRNSSIFVADSENGRVIQYLDNGEIGNEYWTPGAVALCTSDKGYIYVLSQNEGLGRIEVYNPANGDLADVLTVPVSDFHLSDTSLAKLAADSEGNVYVTYGLAPYKIWKVMSDGSGAQSFTRPIDHPADTILISDIALDKSGTLRALLARKEFGLQIVDSFTSDGQFIGSDSIPYTEKMLGVICAADDSEFYLLDTDTGPGGGEVMRISFE